MIETRSKGIGPQDFQACTYASFTQAAKQLAGLKPLDYFFAKEIFHSIVSASNEQGKRKQLQDKEDLSQLFHVLIMLSESLRQGHSCLPLKEIASKYYFSMTSYDEKTASLQSLQHGITFHSFKQLSELFSALSLCYSDEQAVVFSHQRLYLRRYYIFEQELKNDINNRRYRLPAGLNDSSAQLDHEVLSPQEADIQDVLAILFPKVAGEISSDTIDWQKVAVANAINKNFCIIAGGPGTGKTYTVTKLLAALFMLAKNTPLRTALVAPTGKAAQRLSESIINAVQGFRGQIDDDILNLIPQNAQTIHRLLGVIPEQVNFKHNQDNLLALDILLIDEVSMVDLPMMTRIFRALPKHTKVILLGDADQLPSVAVGSVLADLAARPHQGYSEENTRYLTTVTGEQQINANLKSLADKATINLKNLPSKVTDNVLIEQYSADDCVTFLTKSRRFDGKGGIGQIAHAVILGDYETSWQLLTDSQMANNATESAQLSLLSDDLSTWLPSLVEQYYQPLFQCQDIAEAFKLLAQFRILSSTRKGPQGVENINASVIELFKAKGLVGYNHSLYASLPIMISENDYRLGVYNGDIGLLWHDPQGMLMAVFENAEGGFNWIMPSRLPKFEAVYAMTIHKTQGSEFGHVAMVLPQQQENKLLSRELLYTGITRAKSHLSVASNAKIWRSGVIGHVVRHSGLALN